MIDYDFISELEGFEIVGYVPDYKHSNSGVTIACGFDIGQRSIKELHYMFECYPDILDQLIPYTGLKGEKAVIYLKEHPLRITTEEAKIINKAVHLRSAEILWKRWVQATNEAFNTLPPEVQTVIASVAFQYGNLEKRCPNFWHQVTKHYWNDALQNLRNFGDRYSTRRNKEADLLESYIDNN